jgi:hypothetical protein
VRKSLQQQRTLSPTKKQKLQLSCLQPQHNAKSRKDFFVYRTKFAVMNLATSKKQMRGRSSRKGGLHGGDGQKNIPQFYGVYIRVSCKVKKLQFINETLK